MKQFIHDNKIYTLRNAYIDTVNPESPNYRGFLYWGSCPGLVATITRISSAWESYPITETQLIFNWTLEMLNTQSGFEDMLNDWASWENPTDDHIIEIYVDDI